jgi:glycosyltransferase involved in cell wall biosynthesis
MKVLLVNTYDHGGAAKACIRLHKGLLLNGIQSSLLFLSRSSSEEIANSYIFSIHPNNTLLNRARRKIKQITGPGYPERMKNKIRSFIPDKIEYFSFPDSGIDITTHPAYRDADIVNLHWVSDFIDYSFFKKNTKPVVWTIHDMNPFTGGCHYAGDCNKYLNDCAKCQQLSVCEDDKYSHYIFKQKQKYLSRISNLAVVSPSQWLKNVSQHSYLFGKFPHYCIPNGKDSLVFISHDKMDARRELGLPIDKKIILFVSHSLYTKRKGYPILKAAIEMLKQDDIILCSVGSNEKILNDNIQIKELGHIQEERTMSLIYSAVDLFVIPSIQDNLPNTVVESLLCGTPVVGFCVGGITDMIENGKNGYIVESIDSSSFAAGILFALKNISHFNRKQIRESAVLKYDFNVQANSYISLYCKNLLQE